MNLFKTFKLKWWQVSVFKISLVSFGILVGLYFSDFFSGLIPLLLLGAIIPGAYISYVWYKQK